MNNELNGQVRSFINQLMRTNLVAHLKAMNVPLMAPKNPEWVLILVLNDPLMPMFYEDR
ncbi:MAG: hypothetical protein ACXQTA_00785 [Candidatus Syntropharchaeales archaeon]